MYIHYTSCTHSNITPLPLHDALPILTDAPIQRVWPILGEANDVRLRFDAGQPSAQASDGRADEDRAEPRRHPSDRKSTRLNSSHLGISYAVFCLEIKIKNVIM